MPENDTMDTEAGDELDQDSDNETTENDGGRDDTYFLPKDALDGQEVKAGDIIKFKVIGEDKDGNVEVECLHGKDGKGDSKMSWQDDLRANVPNEGGPPPQSY